jgi:hypothetical protein
MTASSTGCSPASGRASGTVPPAPRESEDEVPEPPVKPATRPGDLWLLGDHRLLCGDATCAADVERLLAGAKPHLMVTDPPYGVDYDPDWRNAAGVSKPAGPARSARTTGATGAPPRRSSPATLPTSGTPACIMLPSVAESLITCGFSIRSQIVWSNRGWC